MASTTSSAAALQCVVVTPEATVIDTPAEFDALPLYDGEAGIAPGRSPLIFRLGYGELRIRRPGDAMIRQMNPDMQDDTMAYARDAMKANGILTSGDARTLGIGAMTAERWQRFYKEMTSAGALPPGIDVAKTHTLAFVNKKVGVL